MKRTTIAAICVLLLSGCQPSDPAEAEGRHAAIACREWVKQRLKSPATAAFPVEISARKTHLDIFELDSHVDSQNSFGAQIRTRFTCEVDHAGGQWRLVRLDLSE